MFLGGVLNVARARETYGFNHLDFSFNTKTKMRGEGLKTDEKVDINDASKGGGFGKRDKGGMVRREEKLRR